MDGEAQKAIVPARFSWALALAGAVSALGVVATLRVLGTSLGLNLTIPLDETVTRPLFTGAAAYNFATIAFASAVGGYVSGRLLGVHLETKIEEEVRAGTHGFVAWALEAVAICSALPVPVRLKEVLGGPVLVQSGHINFWIAVSLIFGAVVAIFAAIFARLEDDRENAPAVKSLLD